MSKKINASRVGSSVEDFLREEGIFEECEAEANARIERWAEEQARLKEGSKEDTDVVAAPTIPETSQRQS